ncbi:hypothetical protein BKA70DRAFT_1230831 [Coprinopsis sp. MPI-PUGE-AT-0042]|nr:hypothetical protein BKA70DRAFT_1230831 [Coprinopsis sp. MPI-PUGE-AT-0042]
MQSEMPYRKTVNINHSFSPETPPIDASPEALRRYRLQVRSSSCMHPSVVSFVSDLLVSLPMKAPVDTNLGVAIAMLLVEVLQAMTRTKATRALKEDLLLEIEPGWPKLCQCLHSLISRGHQQVAMSVVNELMLYSNETYSLVLHTMVGLRVIVAFAMSPPPLYLDSLVEELAILTAVIRDPTAPPLLGQDLKRFYRNTQTERHAFTSAILKRIQAMADRVSTQEVPFEPFLMNAAEIASSFGTLRQSQWLWTSFLDQRIPATLMSSIHDGFATRCSTSTPVGNDLREQVVDATFALMDGCLSTHAPTRHHLPTIKDLLLTGYLKIMISYVHCVSDKAMQDRYLGQINTVAGLSVYAEVQPAIIHLVQHNVEDLGEAFSLVPGSGDRSLEYLARIIKLAERGAVLMLWNRYANNSVTIRRAIGARRVHLTSSVVAAATSAIAVPDAKRMIGRSTTIGACADIIKSDHETAKGLRWWAPSRLTLNQWLHVVGYIQSVYTHLCNDQDYSSKDPFVLDPNIKTAWNIDCTRFPFPVVMEQGPPNTIIFTHNQYPEVQAKINNLILLYESSTPMNLLHGLLPFAANYDVHVLLLVRPTLTPEGKITCSSVSSFLYFDCPLVRPVYHQLEASVEGACGGAGPSPPVVVVTAE